MAALFVVGSPPGTVRRLADFNPGGNSIRKPLTEGTSGSLPLQKTGDVTVFSRDDHISLDLSGKISYFIKPYQ